MGIDSETKYCDNLHLCSAAAREKNVLTMEKQIWRFKI